MMDCVPLALPVFLVQKTALAEPVAHINTGLIETQAEEYTCVVRIASYRRRSLVEVWVLVLEKLCGI